MARVVWSRPSVADLAEIRRYVARDSEQYARRMIERIYHAVDRLMQFPLSGRIMVELTGNEREVIVPPYRVIYRYDAPQDRAIILAVIHGSRELPREIGERQA